jgi:hypothetical protein
VRAKGGLKLPLDADILATKSAKLSKGILPRAIASVTMARITPGARGSLDSFSASGSKTGRRDPSSKTMPEAKKVTSSAKKRIILATGALEMLSLDGTQE